MASEFMGLIIMIAVLVIGSLIEKFGKTIPPLPPFPPAVPEDMEPEGQWFPIPERPLYQETTLQEVGYGGEEETAGEMVAEEMVALELVAPEYLSTEGESDWTGDTTPLSSWVEFEGSEGDDWITLEGEPDALQGQSKDSTEMVMPVAWNDSGKMLAFTGESLAQAVVMKEVLSLPLARRRDRNYRS